MSDEKQDTKTAPKKPEPELSPEEAAFAKDKKRTPDQWCARLKKYKLGPKRGKLARFKLPIWQHSQADAMGGWSQHAHDANEPFRLTQEDYEGALQAMEDGKLAPPKGAISKYCKIKHDAKPGA